MSHHIHGKVFVLWLLLISPLAAQESPAKAQPTESVTTSFDELSARGAVREGNIRLLDGQPNTALDAYAHAKALRPNAPQVPFVEGLAHLAQKDFDAARDAFRKVAASDNGQLASDALYSIGASYHLQAMENSENPEQAIEKLEAAMDRYREVLADRPDHAAARESDYKAASMRRQLKQLLQQQQQKQQQDQQDGQDEQQQDQQQQPSDQNQQQNNQQEKQSSDEQQQQEQQQQQSGDEAQQESEEDEEQQVQANEEDISREQAERRLREMMQAIRERQEKRQNKVRKVPLPPVEKDW